LNHILIASPSRFRFASGVSQGRVFFKYWLPALVWMAVIFTASGDTESAHRSSTLFEPLLRWLFPHLPLPHIETLHYIFRKMCHLTEYALLALLLWRALHYSRDGLSSWSWPKVGGTLLLVFLYSATDEVHQGFVPGRTAQFSDVLIDTLGGAIGLLTFWLYRHFRRRFRSPPP
jgi:VanZ family protein